MCQINIAATDILRGNMREGHHSVIIPKNVEGLCKTHNHSFIHRLLDLCQPAIPNNGQFNEPLSAGISDRYTAMEAHVFHCL